jgi:hypothetical protein
VRQHGPFLQDDLQAFDLLLDQATAVVPMRDIAAGATDPRIVGLRHDVDNHLEPAVEMAAWEAARGYRSTYFILHGNGQPDHYWYRKAELRVALDVIADHGHEIGFHCNAIAEAVRTGRDPLDIADEALHELRGYGHQVVGVVAHGDPLCHQHLFVNDEIFTDSPRPTCGLPDRKVGGVKLGPVPRALLGLEYDANWLSRGEYLSDSGGTWSRPFHQVHDGFPFPGQLHILQHMCWWQSAFAPAEVAA